MKTLVILILVALTAMYVTADDGRVKNKLHGPRTEVANEDLPECTPDIQYGACRCPENRLGCSQCNKCRCMGRRGLWLCTRMYCPHHIEGLPWNLVPYMDHRGRESYRCAQPTSVDE